MSMVTFQKVTQFMFIPSTFFTIALNYIAYKSSPNAMRKYKYLIMATSLTVYQFDFVDSVLLTPVNIYRALGLQFYGILGYNYPRDGFYLMLIYIASLSVIGISLTVCFVWREFTLFPFSWSPIATFLHTLHFTGAVLLLIFLYPIYKQLQYTYDELYAFFIAYREGVKVDLNYAIFTILDRKIREFAYFCLYVLVILLYFFTFVGKAVYRIYTGLDPSKASSTTIKLHKMLLRALIFQIIVPVLLFIFPLVISVIMGYFQSLFNFIPSEVINFGGAQVGAVLVTIPSFFSTFHTVSIILITSPYRQYVRKIFGYNTTILTAPQSSVQPVRNENSSGAP